MVVLLVPVAAVLLLIGRRLVPFIYGDAFALAGDVFVLLLPGMTALALYLVVDSYFAGVGFPPISIFAAAGAVSLKVALNWLLVPSFGVLGAAGATSVAYTALFLAKLIAFTRSAHVPVTDVLWPRFVDFRDNLAMARDWVSRRSFARP